MKKIAARRHHDQIGEGACLRAIPEQARQRVARRNDGVIADGKGQRLVVLFGKQSEFGPERHVRYRSGGRAPLDRTQVYSFLPGRRLRLTLPRWLGIPAFGW